MYQSKILSALALVALAGCNPEAFFPGKGSKGEVGERGEKGQDGTSILGAPGKNGWQIGEQVDVYNDVPVDDLVYVSCPETHPVLLQGGCRIDRQASLSGFGIEKESNVNEKTDSTQEVYFCIPGMIDNPVYETNPPSLKAWARCGEVVEAE